MGSGTASSLRFAVVVAALVLVSSVAAQPLPRQVQYPSQSQITTQLTPPPPSPSARTPAATKPTPQSSAAGTTTTPSASPTPSTPSPGNTSPSKPPSLVTSVGNALPFTGLNLLLTVIAGVGLVLAGAAIRRRGRSGDTSPRG